MINYYCDWCRRWLDNTHISEPSGDILRDHLLSAHTDILSEYGYGGITLVFKETPEGSFAKLQTRVKKEIDWYFPVKSNE